MSRPRRVPFAYVLALVLLAVFLVACPATSAPTEEASSAESYAPGRTGEIRELSVVLPGESTPTTVTVEVVDGLAIFQGDIILGEADALSTQSVAISEAGTRWPDGVVPYEIDAALSATMVSRVEAAIQHWNDNTNLTLVERDGETDYVEFTTGSGCSSSVGRQTGRQTIHLASGCSTGNAIHEIGHAIGFWHEQSREDRDQFVEILIDNVQDDKTHNFDLHDDDGTDVGAYDFGSVMHYPATAFGTTDANGNRRTTIRTIPPGIAIGQRNGLSPLDIESANRLYPTGPTPYLELEGPGAGLDEWDDLVFSATVVDDIDVDLSGYALRWTYDQWNGVPFTIDTTASGEDTTPIRLCDGVYTVDVEAVSVPAGVSASVADSVTFTVANGEPKPARCGWSIDIVEPSDGQVFTTADSVRLRAVIDDDHPETDDPLSAVVWRLGGPDGLIIQSPDILDFTRDKWGVGTQVIHVDYGGEASDQISFEVIETTNASPTATITSPSDGDVVNYLNYDYDASAMYLPVVGSGSDVEDGPLSGASLTWSWRVAGTSTWNAGGTGASTELRLPFVSISPSASIEIRLGATDSEDLTSFAIVEVTVLGVQN
jgi:hypothetical protein